MRIINENQKKIKNREEEYENKENALKNHPDYKLAQKRYAHIISKLNYSLVIGCPSESRADLILNGNIKVILGEGEKKLFPEFCLENLKGNKVKVLYPPKFDLNFVENYCCLNQGESYDQINSQTTYNQLDVLKIYQKYYIDQREARPLQAGKVYSSIFLDKVKKRFLELEGKFNSPQVVLTCAQEPDLIIGLENGSRILLKSGEIVNFNKQLCMDNILGKKVKIELPNDYIQNIENYCCGEGKSSNLIKAKVYLNDELISNSI
ncbi:hypothetical protein N9N67_05570 [Bacteriovoracaceae bacterium]|nr:hypothetical protein [Bacteriovoracaceae bacterium]